MAKFDQPNVHAPNPNLKVWLNGRLVPVGEAAINVFDHGVLYGDGVFEGLRSYGGRVFRLKQHLQRLEDSARAIRLVMPMPKEEMTEAIYRTMEANGIRDGYIRLVVTRGVGTLGLSPNRAGCPSVFIIASQIDLYPRELYEKGMAIVSTSIVRNHPNALSARIKSCNYLNNILAKIEAQDAGVHEAIMYNHCGYVAECTGDNIFLVRNGVVQTPPITAGILEGITRDAVIELVRQRSLPIREMDLTRHDLYVADECFLTGSAAEVIPVTSIDGRPIGNAQPGPVTLQLIADFRELVNREE
ncbi:MAG: branched-chain-amino-acid transaminase [Phycisphaerales bacterium]|nr:branched-chain-amino-acid transaminase [Phycisphaerales bacterium]